METIVVITARASRWAAMFVCLLSFVTPCAAGPFTADANDPPDSGLVATLADARAANRSEPADAWELLDAPEHASGTVDDMVVAASGVARASNADVAIDSLTTTDSEAALPSAPLPSDLSRSALRGVAGEERAPGASSLRADPLPGMLESLLGPGVLVRETERTYRALPGMSGTPPVVAPSSATQSPARDGSSEFAWRETSFNIMRSTSAALAVLAVAGILIILAMPGLRRRLFFPDLPPRPA